MKKKIYLNEFIHPAAVERLKEYADVVTDFDRIEEQDGIIVRGTQVTGEMIDQAKNLKVIGRHGIAMNIIDLDAAKRNGVRVLNKFCCRICCGLLYCYEPSFLRV